MSALFIPALPFKVTEGSAQATAPIIRANIDQPGAVWRTNGLTSPYCIVQVTGSFDSVALVSNLRSTDTVRIRTAATAAATTSAPVTDKTVNAWSGFAPVNGAITPVLLDSSTPGPFVRIDFVATSHPAGFVEVSRIVIGQRLTADGVSLSSKQSFEDGSVVDNGPGWTTVDEKRDRMVWETGISQVDEAYYYGAWVPFLRYVKFTRGLVFIPDSDPQKLQTSASLCRITNCAATPTTGVTWAIDFKTKEV